MMANLLGKWDSRMKGVAPHDFISKRNPMPVIKDGIPIFLQETHKIDQRAVSRREVVLNRHFTEILSDVLSNTLKNEFTSMNVQISSIETRAWMKGVRVFYYTNEPFDQHLHDQLRKLVPKLRLAISERNLTGKVPPVDFVYDLARMQEHAINEAIKRLPPIEEKEATDLVESKPHQLQEAKKSMKSSERADVESKNFTAPDDMQNFMLGVDYATLYNEVITKFEKGRGKSARMNPQNFIANTTMLFKDPAENPDKEVEDPMLRYRKMQVFMMNQRKKADHFARIKRREELVASDSYKWELPDEPQEEDEEVLRYHEEDLGLRDN